MAPRSSRLQIQVVERKPAASSTGAASRPAALPAIGSAKPRDAAFQARLKQVAMTEAVKKAAANTAGCKRGGRRKATALPGLITFRGMRVQVPCTIADMSGTGARLVLPASATDTFGTLEHLPDQLVLVLKADRMQVDAEVKWRRTGSLGVRFLGAPVPQQKPQR